jgi:hypothetical protein
MTPDQLREKVMCPMQDDRRKLDQHGDGLTCSQWRDLVETRFHEGTQRMGRIENSLAENTVSTKVVEANTGELIEAFKNLQAALKVLNWIGSMVKPLGYIAAFFAAVVSLWVALKSGQDPNHLK